MVFYNDKLAKMILWSGYHTITIGPFIFTTKKTGEMNDVIINHEKIHVTQWCEVTSVAVLLWLFMMIDLVDLRYMWTLPLCFVVYYIIYVAEYAISRLHGHESQNEDYHHIEFEKEAYKHQSDPTYLTRRIPFNWLWKK